CKFTKRVRLRQQLAEPGTGCSPKHFRPVPRLNTVWWRPILSERTGVATMLVQIDENSASLTPFGSLARHILPDAPTAETKSWSELLHSVLSQVRQKRSHEISAEPPSVET